MRPGSIVSNIEQRLDEIESFNNPAEPMATDAQASQSVLTGCRGA